MSSYTDESIQLFKDLAKIKRKLLVVESLQAGPDTEDILQVINLLESKTQNYAWRDEIAKTYSIPVSAEWSENIQNEINATLARCKDPVYLGNVYVRLGRYIDALSCYNRSSVDQLTLTSNLLIFEQNWSYVATTVGRMFEDWHRSISEQEKGPAPSSHPKQKPSSLLMLNLALAYFALSDFSNCLFVLLYLDIPEPEDLIWLSFENIKAMLFSCAVVSLDRSILRHFQMADAMAHYFKVHTLFEPVMNCNLEGFWATVETLEFPPYVSTRSIRASLRDRIDFDWLQLHVKLPLDMALRELGRQFHRQLVESTDSSKDEEPYQVEDLRKDLIRWNLPYDIDLVNSWVVLRSDERDGSLTVSKMHSKARELAAEYKRDTLVLLWTNHNKKSGLETQ